MPRTGRPKKDIKTATYTSMRVNQPDIDTLRAWAHERGVTWGVIGRELMRKAMTEEGARREMMKNLA